MKTQLEQMKALHAKMVESACKTGKFWVQPLQRPMHFYPKLRSQPWWDASDFPWTLKLMTPPSYHSPGICPSTPTIHMEAKPGTKYTD